MALVVERGRSSFLVLRYVEQKPNGSFQYRRRIPEDVQPAYGGKAFFVKSLKRDLAQISRLSARLTESLDYGWHRLRSHPVAMNDPALARPFVVDGNQSVDISVIEASDEISCHSTAILNSPVHPGILTLSEALSLYLRFHRNGSEEKFIADNTRAIMAVINQIGDLPINCYTRLSAERYRDELLKKQSSGTVRRRLRMVCAIFNRAKTEKQLQILNPFEGLGIAGEGEDGTQRLPFTGPELSIVSLACRGQDDDIRHIIALQMDTGCRVAEIVGLRAKDVNLEQPIPYIRIRPWGKVRTLKTPASERAIPLVGDALWAAECALEAHGKAKEPGSWLFPRYASDQEIKATHASNTLNKWLRGLEGVCDQKTTHCFRHAFRDRLRAAQVPLEIQDCLGGWGSRSVGQGYGSGYPLQVLAEHMKKCIGRI